MTEREGVRVLLIEDDAEDAILLRAALRASTSMRYDMDRVDDLQTGLEHLGNGHYDVVLLDLSLPDSSGLSTLDNVLEVSAETPVVVVTGQEDEALGIQAVRAGAQDFLPKRSIDSGLLPSLIHHAIERCRLSAELQSYRDHLEELVEERTLELRKAFGRLEAEDRAKTEFVSNVSHELKTPLTSMSYALQNLLDGVRGPVPEAVREYLEMLQEDCVRLRKTVADVLDVSRAEMGTLTLNRFPVPFGRFCCHAVKSMRINAERKGLKLALDCRSQKDFVCCDAPRLERCIVNVLQNAVKYTSKGGALDVLIARETVNGEYVSIDVTDTGVGITPDHLPRVTERYYRVGEHIDGTGLGLHIAKEIVDRHGGSLDVLSPPPGRTCGTQVRIRLPVTGAPVLLTVDDEESVHRLLRAQLDTEGYRVECRQRCEEAVELVRKTLPHGLIVDLVMPNMSGVEMIAAVKADPELCKVPVLAMIGFNVGDTEREILDGFHIPVLQKPWSREALLNAVFRLLLLEGGHAEQPLLAATLDNDDRREQPGQGKKGGPE